MNDNTTGNSISLKISLYRYDPDRDRRPRTEQVSLQVPAGKDLMVLDVMHLLKESDPTLAFRQSCREGVCGSDAVNMNGRNGLACITPLSSVLRRGKLSIRPLPGLPVIRDLIVDMDPFYRQYERMKPYLINDEAPPERERLQSPAERQKLDGLYECILCACCSTSCPSFWWNPDKFAGPAALLQALRFLNDSRDRGMAQRLEELRDPYSLFRCHSIMNCVDACPKGLNPTRAIGEVRQILLSEGD